MHGTGAYGMDGRKKGGAKGHVIMRAQDQVPCFIDLTEGRRNDKTAMASIPLAKGSVLVFDMGYTSFEQWQARGNQGVHWVTRLQDGVRLQVTEHLPMSDAHRDDGVIGDQLVLLGTGGAPLPAHCPLPSQAHRPPLPLRDQQHALGAHHHRSHLQMSLGHQTALKAGQAGLSAALPPGRQPKRDRSAARRMVRLHRRSLTQDRSRPRTSLMPKALVIRQHRRSHPHTPPHLHRCRSVPARPRQSLAALSTA